MNDDLCELVGRLARAPQVYIYAVTPSASDLSVLGSFGFHPRKLAREWHFPEIETNASNAVAYPNTATAAALKRHPILSSFPPAKSLLVLRLPEQRGSELCAMVVVNPDPHVFRDYERVAALLLLVKMIPAESGRDFSPAGLSEAAEIAGVAGLAATNSSAANFLFRTLPRKHRLLARNGISFTALRTWRAPLREYQIEALRSLKDDPPREFVKLVAQEMATAMLSQLGADFIQSVVPVPCGSSQRSNCLSVRIAKEMAGLLHCSFVEALAGEFQPGASHPKKSAKLAEYEVIKIPTGPTLVIDDVVTSGKHMELAIKVLRSRGVNCFATSWIAA